MLTDGEPLLQADASLIDALHALEFEIGVETSGTQSAPIGLYWTCISPKTGADLILKPGDELKLVFPLVDAPPPNFEDLDFAHFFLQPMDGDGASQNVELTIAYCFANPQWRLSLQSHKLIGIR